MIDDLAFVELAKYCVRTCHVLKTATEKRGVGSLSEAMGKAIESLEKYVVPAHPSLQIITSNTRAMRCIESKVRECALDANYSQERHPDPILWKMEIDGILGVLDVCGCHFRVLQLLNCPRLIWSWMISSWPTEMNNVHSTPPIRNPRQVFSRRCVTFYPST